MGKSTGRFEVEDLAVHIRNPGAKLFRPFGAQTRLLSGGGSGVFLDQHDQVVGSIPDGGNVRLGERLIRNELLANAI